MPERPDITRSADPADEEPRSPIPTQFVSNGEFWPLPQSRRQRLTEQIVAEMAERRATRLGLSRRRFLQTPAGMAVALAAIQLVYGCSDDDASGAGPSSTTLGSPATTDGGFAVPPEATEDPEAACELFAGEFFVLDSQTHHVDFEGPGDPYLLDQIFSVFSGCPPAGFGDGDCEPASAADNLSRANYLREIFLDSETTVAMMSGIPASTVAAQPISNDGMAETCRLVNELGSSQRCITQGMVTPNFPDSTDTGHLGTLIRDIEHLKEDLDIRALKCYTGAGGPGSAFPFEGWWLDDEDVAYPMYEEARRVGVDVVNVHKGFEQGVFDPEFCGPRDVPQAVRDWPDMNFVIFHSAVDLPPYERYFDDLVELRTNEIPEATNVFAEFGGAWATKVIQGGDAAGHLLGKLLRSFGEDQILWGTDSIWFGSPQWQISALKAFTMPPRLREDFGYPEVTDEIKAKIFGLNAARLYGVDPDEARCVVADDLIGEAKVAYEHEQADRNPSLRTYGPTTRREFLHLLRAEGHR